jgi:hypothetical protein
VDEGAGGNVQNPKSEGNPKPQKANAQNPLKSRRIVQNPADAF